MNPVRNTKQRSAYAIVSNGMNKLTYAAAVLFMCFVCLARIDAQDTDQEKELNMKNPFGVLEFLHWNHDWNSYKYSSKEDLTKAVKLMKEAGIGWIRMDFLWDEIEPEQGKFDFAKYDEIVDLVTKNNINMLGIFNYSASWAAACGGWNCPPGDNQSFVNYAVKVIERYKDKIRYWEVWNEPDSSTYWANQDGLKSYCALLKDVYAAAKKADPECRILNGGLASGLASVNKLYDNGAKGYFDILNIHIFEDPLRKNAIKAVTAYPKLVHKIMLRNGDARKNIWITEIGCPGVRRGLKADNWWQGRNPSEIQQAAWVKKVYTELLKDRNVEKIFWAFFRDCKEHWYNGIDYFGLVRWDFSRKSAFFIYKASFNKWRKSLKVGAEGVPPDKSGAEGGS